MLTSPTAIRLLEEQGLEYPSRHDTNSLRNLFLAGEPLDEATSCWASEGLGVPVRNTYWQTETGWPVLSSMLPGLKDKRTKPGSVGLPVYGYDLRLVRKETGEEVTVGESGVLTIAPPLPPGCASVVRGEDESFVETYFSEFSDQCLYSTFDWAERDKEGEYFILGRSDDLVEVCGRRFGTRDLEEAITSHAKIREAAVVSVAGDKGQSILAYVVPKDRDRARFETYRSEFECDIKETVVSKLGAVARPNAVYFVSALPKTSSGKVLHRCIRALVSQQDPGDLSTIKDPSALDEVQATKPDLGT
jgi:propionyl-CoA synthetase